MTVYLDSSALLKLLVAEPEQAALQVFLGAQTTESHVSSALVRVEVPRAASRVSHRLVVRADELVDRLDLIPMEGVLDVAASISPPTLRSLDAIHLASALAVRGVLTAFVAYDRRLIAAARDQGLQVAHPGMTLSR